MGKFTSRQGLSSLANSDIVGQLSIAGGGASIPLLVDGATNRLLTLSDTNSAADAVLAVQDSDGDLLFEVRPSGIRIGGNYQLPLADSAVANYFLRSNAAGTVQWANPFSSLTLGDITDIELSPLSTTAVDGAYLRYDAVNGNWVADGPHAGFHAVRQTGSITKGTPVKRTGSGNGGGIYEMGVGATNNSSRCVGIAYEAQDASSRLIVMTDGLIGGLDTSGYSTDDILYVSNTSGELTNVAPTSGLYQQRVARVVSSDATTGIIQVTVDPAFDEAEYLENVSNEAIGSLSNVNVSGASSGNLLRYDGSEWVDTTLTIPASATVASGTTEVLKFTTSHTGSIAELDLGELGDVDLTTTAPTTNDVLQYDGSNWVPAAGGGGTPTLEEVLTEGDTATSSNVKVGYLQAETPTNGSTITAISRDSSNSDWPAINVWRDTSSPADDDTIGNISWKMDNDASTFTEFAKIVAVAHDVSAGDEEGEINFHVMKNGVMTDVGGFGADGHFRLESDLFVNDGKVSVNLTSAGYAFETVTSDSAASWTKDRVIKFATTTAGDSLGDSEWYGLNSTSGLELYASQEIRVEDNTAGSTDASIAWKTKDNGTLQNTLELDSGRVKISDAFTLPGTDGTSGQMLTTNGSGVVSWGDATVADVGDIGNVNLSSPSTNQVLIYNQITSTWSNGSAPVPTLAEVTASGASTSTTVTLANILQTGTHVSVAASGNWFTQHRFKTLEVGASTGSLAYTFPAADGSADQVITTDGSGTLTWESPKKNMTFWNQGIYQLSTSNDTLYRFSTGTSYPNYGLWNSTSSTVPSSLTRTPQRTKGGHIIPEDITGATIKCKVGFAVGSNTALSSSASEYLGDTINFAVYRWPDGGVAVLVDEFTGTINGGNTTGEEEAEITITNATLNEGDVLCLVSRCLQQASSTRYMSINYTMQIEY